MSAQAAFAITDESAVGAARRHAAELAHKAGLSETDKGRVGLVVTELGRNIALHAGRGTLFMRCAPHGSGAAMEVLAVDSGPGMADMERCLRDGYSTTGTSGTGLGAVRRLSSFFDAYTRSAGGTIVLSRVLGEDTTGELPLQCGVISTCAPGERECGDGWSIVRRESDISVLVADGLGHGPDAAVAAKAAIKVFEERPFAPLNALFDEQHRTLRKTRGAAVAIAQFAGETDVLLYAGVGNIAGSVLPLAGRGRGLVSGNGTVGAHMRQAQPFAYDWPVRNLLVMHSDGLRSGWSLEGYPGLATRHPAIIAAVLHRDFLRGNDDATIVVLRRGG